METPKKRSTAETGHNKNVANFSSAYTIAEGMGPLYQPTNTNLLLTALAPIKTQLAGVVTTLDTQKPIYKNAVAARETAIKPLSKTITKSLNSAKSIQISATDKENLTAQAKKIRGYKKPKKINPDTTPTEEISTSQMSYDNRIANFATYNAQLASHPQYAPNENEVKVATLTAYQTELSTLSSTVNTSGIALITARTDRNNILYHNALNVLALIKDMKAYLLSLGEVGKPYYKALVRLKFRDI